jgi:hypothetical protein
MAAATYFDQVQQLYIAYFGRPADPVGQAYWAAQIDAAKGSIAAVIAGFSASTESTALFGGSTSTQKVTAIYQNAFGRLPEAAGLAYWVAQLESGKVTQAQASWTIQQSAGVGDATAVANKLAAAKAFTAQIDTAAELSGYSGAVPAASARSFLTQVDASPASLANALSSADFALATATNTLFTVVEDPTTHAVSFGGYAIGDITVAWSGTVGSSVATFTREGFTSPTVNYAATATGISLASTDVLSTTVANLGNLTVLGTGSIKLTDTSVTAAALNNLDLHSTPTINAGTVTNVIGAATDIKTFAGAAGITKTGTWIASVTDSSVAATDLIILDAATTGAVNVSGNVVGNFADVNTVETAAGISLSVSTSSLISDTAANLTGKTLSAVGPADALYVGAATANTNLSGLTGFEAIHLSGSSGGSTISIANGAGTVVDTSSASSVTLGSGGQTFIGSSGNDTVMEGTGADRLTGGAGTNVFLFSSTHFTATTTSTALIAAADTITDWTAGTNNTITFTSSPLSVAAAVVGAVSGTAAISATGLATFNPADNTLVKKLDAVVSAMGTDIAGSSAVFTDSGNSYLFVVGNATAGIQAGDALIQLTGVTVASGLTFGTGSISSIS